MTARATLLLAALLLATAPFAAESRAEDRVTIEALGKAEIMLYDDSAEPVGSLKDDTPEAASSLPQSYAKGDENEFGLLPFVIDGKTFFVDPFDVKTSTEPLECPTGSTVAGQGVRSTAGSGSKVCL
jgi:hypothetical protein